MKIIIKNSNLNFKKAKNIIAKYYNKKVASWGSLKIETNNSFGIAVCEIPQGATSFNAYNFDNPTTGTYFFGYSENPMEVEDASTVFVAKGNPADIPLSSCKYVVRNTNVNSTLGTFVFTVGEKQITCQCENASSN